VDEAAQDIRSACTGGTLPDLDVEVLDIMVEDLVTYARCQVNRKNYDGRLSVCHQGSYYCIRASFPLPAVCTISEQKLNNASQRG
jgi:hypothetical protein